MTAGDRYRELAAATTARARATTDPESRAGFESVALSYLSLARLADQAERASQPPGPNPDLDSEKS